MHELIEHVGAQVARCKFPRAYGISASFSLDTSSIERRTDETPSQGVLSRLNLAKDARFSDMEQDLGRELDLFDVGEQEAVLSTKEEVMSALERGTSSPSRSRENLRAR